jgi:cellulose synthase/poly-beta-1,6-N-acetylglucosamine synthase-like glycosyltransferase
MADTLLTVLAVVYAAILCTAAVAVRRVFARAPVPAGSLPPAAVVVPARNEEGNIGPCLDALAAQEYPAGLLRVVVVDDGSTDRTAERIAGHAARCPQITPLRMERNAGTPPGKTGALAAGIAAAGGEILLLTDADCIAPPGWAGRLASAFTDPDISLAAGFTLVEGRTLFSRLQALDWLFLVSLAAAGTAAGLPLTAVGTNLAVRRRAYEAVGGFAGLPFSVTEDHRLFSALVGNNPRRAWFVADPAAAVTTMPCGTWADFLRQKKRWFLGGVEMGPLRIGLFLVLALFHLALPLLLPLTPLSVLAAASVKLAGDALLLLPALRAFGLRRLFPLLPLYELLLTAYVVLVPLLLLLRPVVVWKGRPLKNERAPRHAGRPVS